MQSYLTLEFYYFLNILIFFIENINLIFNLDYKTFPNIITNWNKFFYVSINKLLYRFI